MADFFIAFFAGILTILSPCVLPIVPIVLASSLGKSKSRPFFVTLGLIFGFTLIGTLFGIFGSLLPISRLEARYVGIGLILLLGIFLLFPQFSHFIANIFTKSRFFRWQHSVPNSTRWSNFLLGIGLGFAWIPCTAPISGTVFGLSFLQENITQSIILTLLFAIGLATPLITIGYLGNFLVNQINWLKKHLPLIQKIAGGVITLVGIAMLLNLDQEIQRLFLT